jgi:membrane-associated HD superfamily phosphohydrolase
MNLSISIPNHINTLEVSNLTKEELISELYDYWLAGVELTECTTDLPKNIIDLSKFNAAWIDAVDIANISNNETTEQEIKEALEQCISDEWDVLNELINQHGEDFAEACLEYANGGSLEDAEQSYIGQYDSNKEYCEEVFECPDNIRRYIDWEAVWADYCHYVTEIDGYYFNS